MRIWSASRFPTRIAVAAPAAAPMPAPLSVLSCEVTVVSRAAGRGVGVTSGFLWLEHAGTSSPATTTAAAMRRCDERHAPIPVPPARTDASSSPARRGRAHCLTDDGADDCRNARRGRRVDHGAAGWRQWQIVSAAGLDIRFLGEIEVVRDGVRVELPPSKKTRGLLAYLVLTGRPHRRDRLCQLLWDVADDPRGALRWSLSRIRALVDEPSRARVVARKDTVSFEAQGALVDILALKARAAAGLEGATTEELLALAAEFRGELLEGLDLGDFLDFQAFCVAEREEARKLHAALRRALVGRLAQDPEAALAHARVLAAVDPLNEAARAGLVRLLAATGRRGEAEQQYEAARRMLTELGGPPSAELETALRSVGDGGAPHGVGVEPERAAPPAPPVGAAFVGRAAERARLDAILARTALEARENVVLLTGEPGLGKSRLLDAVRERARARGATILEGRAFEAEAGRPYGPWIDALRGLPADAVSPALGADLAALLPELARADGAPASRDRLFVAVVELLAARAAAAPPVVVTIDDVQWLDAASAEMLHYVARMSRHRRLFVALSARAGELHDNEAARRALEGLREMKLLEEMTLEPFGLPELR